MVSTILLYLKDSYQKEFDAKVSKVIDKNKLILNQTIFYYTSGGQPCDEGKLTSKKDAKEIRVIDVRKINGEIIHTIDGEHNLLDGDEVHGEINWYRRYKFMRMHTAAHILAAIMFKHNKIMITGNQLGLEHTRFDFNMQDFNRGFIQKSVNEANEECQKGYDVKIYSLPTSEALKIEGISKLKNALPPNLKELRIVQIANLDIQADGGTHVKNTKEIKKIIFEKAQNKGKANRRIYFTLEN